ncbi:MAG: saccharopine dehydrogenase NADP-binding domain-containing protein [Bradymonadaceae bacterium]|nr:saccharopine dehydrogenase NADP-binding domain-containing protein [Lujinxingiaceae bacterium]
MREKREFEIVLFGATGFTGRLIAEYLAEHHGDSGLRWAIAGRSAAKLEALRDELGLASLPVLVADSHDRASLDAIAARTRVVCTTVGPYARYGDALVAACVAGGTDYCDLTGEVQWMQRTIDTHHEAARARGARIVHCCGFDSIPSDLGTLMIQDFALEQWGAPCTQVKFVVWRLSGAASGGTLATVSNSIEEMGHNHEARRAMADPYALNPAAERRGPDGNFQRGVRHEAELDAWTAPFLMAPVNEKVVRRSNALLDYRYSRDFRYGESMSLGRGPMGALKAIGFTAGVGAFVAAMAIAPTRKLLERYALPAPGEGPSRDQIENGHFTIRLFGRGVDAEQKPFKVMGEVSASRDPGYGATAIMLAESAICLAREVGDIGLPAGVLTPASAMGQRLVERLRGANMVFDVRND